MKDDQASLTALTVLQGILATAKNPEYQHLVSEEEKAFYIHILESSKAGQKKLRQLRSPLQHKILRLAESLLMPGISLHYILRKRFIEKEVRGAIKDGYNQIISLGAGFDSLCWRLSNEHTDLSFIEIDHPESSALKQEALKRFGDINNNISFLKVDFSERTLFDTLQHSPSFQSEKRTLFICEGVMMYLNSTDVSVLMESVSQLGGENSQFIFTAVEPLSSVNNNTGKLLKLVLHFMSEPLNWTIEATNTKYWVNQHHYNLAALATYETFKQQFLTPSDMTKLHRGEFVVVAQPNSSASIQENTYAG